MPHFITQLLHLLVLLPPHTAYVSIYESNSGDDTGIPHSALLFTIAAVAWPAVRYT